MNIQIVSNYMRSIKKKLYRTFKIVGMSLV